MNHPKIPTTKYAVNDLIKNRWSARSFAEKAISQDDINTIMEAASWAPSAMNEQPWRYIVARRENTESFERLAKLLAGGNAWAKHAGALVLCYAKQTYTSKPIDNHSAQHDTGMANQNILLQALSMGIYGHVLGGYDHETAAKDFNLVDDYKPIVMIALGYLGEAEQLEEPFKTREVTARSRKAIEEFVAHL